MSSTVDSRTAIRRKFETAGSPATISLLKGDDFSARLVAEGIEVDNLGTQSLLSWQVFDEALGCLRQNGGRAKRGDAMNHRLGDPELALNSVEGHVAHVVFGKQPGDSVFRRITPIACILIWAGICEARPGELLLVEGWR